MTAYLVVAKYAPFRVSSTAKGISLFSSAAICSFWVFLAISSCMIRPHSCIKYAQCGGVVCTSASTSDKPRSEKILGRSGTQVGFSRGSWDFKRLMSSSMLVFLFSGFVNSPCTVWLSGSTHCRKPPGSVMGGFAHGQLTCKFTKRDWKRQVIMQLTQHLDEFIHYKRDLVLEHDKYHEADVDDVKGANQLRRNWITYIPLLECDAIRKSLRRRRCIKCDVKANELCWLRESIICIEKPYASVHYIGQILKLFSGSNSFTHPVPQPISAILRLAPSIGILGWIRYPKSFTQWWCIKLRLLNAPFRLEHTLSSRTLRFCKTIRTDCCRGDLEWRRSHHLKPWLLVKMPFFWRVQTCWRERRETRDEGRSISVVYLYMRLIMSVPFLCRHAMLWLTSPPGQSEGSGK